MPLTLTSRLNSVFGNVRVAVYDIDFDSSYPDGGEALAASAIGFSEIFFVDPIPRDEASGKMIYNWDSTNGKLQIFYPSGGTAPASLADPAHTVTSGAVAMTGSAAVLAAITETAGRGVELADTTDASSLKIRALIVGV